MKIVFFDRTRDGEQFLFGFLGFFIFVCFADDGDLLYRTTRLALRSHRSKAYEFARTAFEAVYRPWAASQSTSRLARLEQEFLAEIRDRESIRDTGYASHLGIKARVIGEILDQRPVIYD